MEITSNVPRESHATDPTANNVVMVTADNMMMQLVQCPRSTMNVFNVLRGIVIFDQDSLGSDWCLIAKNIISSISVLPFYLFQVLK